MTEQQMLLYLPDLIEHQAKTLGKKPYILWGEEKISFEEFNLATCRAANGLAAYGGEEGDGLAILMGNCPEFLYLFYGLPRGGFYTVPVNVSLKGEGLKFILTHSEVKFWPWMTPFIPRSPNSGPPWGPSRKSLFTEPRMRPFLKGP